MNAHRMGRVALILMGIGLLVRDLWYLPAEVMALPVRGLSPFAYWGLPYVPALVLLVFRRAVSNAFFGDDRELPWAFPSTANLCRAVVGIIGLWVVVRALPGLVLPTPDYKPGIERILKIVFRWQTETNEDFAFFMLMGGALLLIEAKRLANWWARDEGGGIDA